MRPFLTITVMVLALLAGACGWGNPDVPRAASPPAPDVTRTVSPSAMERCTNPQDGYRLSYPAGWHTNDGEILPTCTVFDDDPVELTAGTEVPFDVAVFLDIVDRPITELDDDDRAVDVIDRQTRRVGDRDAVEIRFRSTGDGLLPEGVLGHRILVRLREGATLIASTYEVDDRPLEDNVSAMRRMLRSLETTVASPTARPTAAVPPFHGHTEPPRRTVPARPST